jgi:hypothetical protein
MAEFRVMTIRRVGASHTVDKSERPETKKKGGSHHAGLPRSILGVTRV